MGTQTFRTLIRIAILALLSGCASHINEEFDCPAGKELGLSIDYGSEERN